MMIICDSGSTKVDFRIIDNLGQVQKAACTGLNPLYVSNDEIVKALQEIVLPLSGKHVDSIWFYGAGVVGEAANNVKLAFSQVFDCDLVYVDSDMLGAARALCSDKPGIACILGTGSNSCFYDGSRIVQNVHSGGYILGDEGSGAVLGKYFLSDVLKEVAPKELIELFYDTFRITPAMAMESVYQMPFPNRFLATVAYFLSEHMDDDYVYNMVECNLERFFERNITQYDYQAYPIRMMGSSAVLFRAVINNIAEKFGAKVDKIDESAIHGLVEYHS